MLQHAVFLEVVEDGADACGSSTLATIFTLPPQWTQVFTSMPNTRLRRCAQVIDRRLSSGVRWSALASAVASLPRTLGVSCAVTLTGFKPEIDGTDWVITQVSHRFGGGGFSTALELERRWGPDQP